MPGPLSTPTPCLDFFKKFIREKARASSGEAQTERESRLDRVWGSIPGPEIMTGVEARCLGTQVPLASNFK